MSEHDVQPDAEVTPAEVTPAAGTSDAAGTADRGPLAGDVPADGRTSDGATAPDGASADDVPPVSPEPPTSAAEAASLPDEASVPQAAVATGASSVEDVPADVRAAAGLAQAGTSDASQPSTDSSTPEASSPPDLDEASVPGTAQHELEQPGTAQHEPEQPDTAQHEPEQPGTSDAEPAEPETAHPEPAQPAAGPSDGTRTDPEQGAEVAPDSAPTPERGAAATVAVPKPRPVPRALPRPPAGPRPSPGAAQTAAAVPVPPALSAEELSEAARWGRLDEDGTVWVRDGEGERSVGQYPGADADQALALYARRFADLQAKVALLETRMASTDLPPKEADQSLKHLAEELAEPAVVGDLGSLRARLEALRAVAAERRAAAEAERAAAKKAALEARTAIVEAAEAIATTAPDRMQWKPAGEQLRVLLDQWKDAQRHGPRVDRGAEDALWKRFSHARSAFDRDRRRYFSDLEKHNAEARAEKTRLVAEAERLSTSTDWAGTSAAYRDLMARWKNAGRASRKDDDALWARFRAAQDTFFAARDASQKQVDAEFGANLEVKLALLAEAERLLPVRDLNAARAALRDIQERWERAGKVPRGDVQRVEGRLRAVEQAVRESEQNQWQRTNPETRARAEGAAAQLQAAIAGLEADLAAAQRAGDARRVAEAQAALDARRAWLEQVQRAAADSRG